MQFYNIVAYISPSSNNSVKNLKAFSLVSIEDNFNHLIAQ